MRIRYLALFIALLPAVALAQQQPPLPPQVESGVSKIEQHVIPELKFEGLALDEALAYLRESVPGLNVTVVREEGTDPAYPTIQSMSLKDITLGQFFQFVRTSFPGVDIQRIDGNDNPVFVVHVDRQPGEPPRGRFNPAGGFGGFDAGMGMGVAAPPASVAVVRVYNLREIVASLTNDKVNAKVALTDVLSLIEAAIQQMEGDNKPVMKVHEATQTLVFKGSVMQIGIVEEVLKSLRPSADTKQNLMEQQMAEKDRLLDSIRARYDEQVRMLQQRTEQATSELIQTRKELEQTKVENAVLSAKYDQLKAAQPSR